MATRGFEHYTPEQAKKLGRQSMQATMSKYRAVKTVVDGITFDSKREAQRYHELKLLERAGQIQDLTLQPRFDLHVNGVKVCAYVADFGYASGIHGERKVEDVKGVKTAVYQLKKKMLLAEYGIVIQEIR